MSSIKLKGSSSGDVTITVPAAAGTNTVTIPAATGTLPLSNLDHVTNRPNTKPIIINGDMQVAQRGTSVTGVTASGYQTVDRFHINIDTMGTWTITQADDAPTGSGFQHSLKLDCTTADGSPASGDNITVNTKLEGQDLQLFKKGTSSAEKFTVSFWVKATKTGTHILELDDNDNGRNINQAYTINSSDTWEKKVLTFAADTTGAFGNDNGSSLRLFWWVGAGSNFTSGTLETSWASTTNANRAVGQVNNADSTDNNWYITGVQLEVGEYTADTIPPFQHGSYGDNLARCQRYFQIFTQPPLIGSANANNTIARASIGLFPVQMRAAPTAVQSGTLSWFYSNSHQPTSTAFSASYTDVDGAEFDVTVSGTGMTATHPCSVFQSGSAFISFAAEL
jgi:hypothetical protein